MTLENSRNKGDINSEQLFDIYNVLEIIYSKICNYFGFIIMLNELNNNVMLKYSTVFWTDNGITNLTLNLK